jgi:PAS domain S-box-containing protein
MANTSILIVEDEHIVAKNIEKRLIAANYNVVATVSTGEEAIDTVKEYKPDLVLMDIKLKGKIDGIETADVVQKQYQIPVIFLTSYTDENTFQRAKITDPFGYLIKPFELKDLNRVIEIAIYKNKIYKELHDTKVRLDIAIEAGKTGVWEFWPTEKKYFSDDNLKTLYGFEKHELSDNLDDWSALVFMDDRSIMAETFNKFLKSPGREFKLEHRIYRKDGSVGWVVDRGLLFEPDKEKPLRMIGTTTDITDRKEYEIEIKKSEEKFRSVFESSGIGMAMLAPDGHFNKVNQVFCEIMGYDESELLNKNFRDITHPADMEKSVDATKELLKDDSSESISIEKRYLHKSDEIVWALTTISLIRDTIGKPIYFIAQVQDITERKRNEEKLEKYAEELKTLNASKDKFFSIISHDLRSPFNSLLGITEFIAQSFDEMSPLDIKENISMIYQSTQKVYNLILNLLEWSRLQAGRFELVKEKINLNELIESTVGFYQYLADEKQINFTNQAHNNIDVNADRYMIETVLRNLITNAIKFTPKGGTISVSAIKTSNNARITVSDNGVGISAENQKKLFRIDTQFKSDGTAKEKGTGLGLILCKEFVEKNGGNISVESREDEGSNFFFTVPLFNHPQP